VLIVYAGRPDGAPVLCGEGGERAPPEGSGERNK
jgi:hypothetical protein